MEPEETTPRKSKKFLKITLGALVVVVVLLGTAFFLTELKNAKQAAKEQPTVLPSPRVYTQEEKSQILEHIAREAFKDITPEADKVRILQSITKLEPKVSAVSIADKVRILQELEAKTGQ